MPPRQVTGTVTRAVATGTLTRSAGAASSSFAWPEKDVTVKGSVISMKGKRSRRVDFENEISVTDEWATVLSCDASKAGIRTNSSVARFQMKIGTDVAGMTISSQSADSDGKIKLSYVDDSVSLSDQVQTWEVPMKNGTLTGCEVSLKWSRKVEQYGVAQTVELSISFPIILKRQEAAELWTQINQIVVYADKEALEQAKLGETFDPDSVTGSPSSAAGSSTADLSAIGSPTAAASSAPAIPTAEAEGAVQPQSGTQRTWAGGAWGFVVAAVFAVVA